MSLNGAVVEFEAPADDYEPTSAKVPSPWASRLLPINPSWCTTPPPKRQWLLRDRRTPNSDGVLPLGKVGQLVAEGGAGKTMALVQLALAVATGTPWMGALDIASPGRVLAALGEEDAEEIHRRVYAAARAANVPTPAEGMIVTLPLAGLPSPMIQRDSSGNPTDAPFLHWLRTYLQSQGDWRLLIFDPQSRFAGLDAEKDNALATRFVEAVESLAGQTGASALIAHHSNQQSRGSGAKMSGTSGRGVTALHDGVRWAATLGPEQVSGLDADAHDRLGELVTFAFQKSNYSRKGAPITLRRDTVHGGALVPIDSVDLELVDEARRTTSAASRRETEKEARTIERRAQEDAATVAIVTEQPGIGSRELRAGLRGRLTTCSAPAADDAVARALARGVIRREGDRFTGFHHFVAVQDGSGVCQ